MTNDEREILYQKLMELLILLEDKKINKAITDLESLIEYVKFKQVR
jgi:hypothetical protein